MKTQTKTFFTRESVVLSTKPNEISLSTIKKCHNSLCQFFEMQREQERTMQSLIRVQKKLLEVRLTGQATFEALNKTPIRPVFDTDDTERGKRIAETPTETFVARGPVSARAERALYPKVDMEMTTGITADAGKTSQDKTDALLTALVKRYIPHPVAVRIDKNSKRTRLPKDHAILLVGKKPPLISLVEKALADVENPVLHVVPGNQNMRLGKRCYQVNLSSVEAIQELRAQILESVAGIGAIFNLTGLTEAYQGKGLLNPFVTSPEDTVRAFIEKRSGNEPGDESLDDAKDLFLMLKVFIEDLKKSADAGDAWFVNFSFMDGQFGLKRTNSFALGQAGSVGLTKAFAKEWPQIKTKCIDVDPSASPLYLIARVRQEISVFDDLVEIGLDGKDRWKIDIPEIDPASKGENPILLDGESVVLVTGGAYGIVAEVTKELSARYAPRIIIVGRTLFPDDESTETKGLLTASELRNFLIAKMKKENPSTTPAEVRKRLNSILKERQIRDNIEAMKKNGSLVKYHSLDVRDAQAFGNFIDGIYDEWGRLDAVIHGAGVIRDKTIDEKTFESFAQVFDTKVSPAIVLEKKLRPDKLKFLAFFSSMVARFGNAGQTDYAAANEILNKLACRLNLNWAAHVFAINWGPWDSGMVSEELRSFFAEKGFSLIPVKEGVRRFFNELDQNDIDTAEILITGKLPGLDASK